MSCTNPLTFINVNRSMLILDACALTLACPLKLMFGGVVSPQLHKTRARADRLPTLTSLSL